MKTIKRFIACCALMSAGCATMVMAQGAKCSERVLFDNGWEFTHEGKTISVDLPHDWDIYTAPDPETGSTGTGGGWYHAGKGEYTKRFSSPKGDIVRLHFEGVYQKAEVTVNGKAAGRHGYGYTPFTVDITPYLYKDKRKNVVTVKVNNEEQPNCRWYSGSGIYRHVWMETMPSLHIAENGVFVSTPDATAERAVVKVQVTVENNSERDRNASVAVGNGQMMVSLKAGEKEGGHDVVRGKDTAPVVAR